MTGNIPQTINENTFIFHNNKYEFFTWQEHPAFELVKLNGEVIEGLKFRCGPSRGGCKYAREGCIRHPIFAIKRKRGDDIWFLGESASEDSTLRRRAVKLIHNWEIK